PAAPIVPQSATNLATAPIAADAPVTATPAATAPAGRPAFTLPQGWERYAYALPVVALLLLTALALLRLVRLRADAEVLVDPV
ncbi:hypothetical protein INQ29_24795, partial [Escherichia coli]